MPWMHLRPFATALAALLFSALAACSAQTDDPAASSEETGEEALVGGKPESRFQGAGYLAAKDAKDDAALCGATLIAPDVVVTAAHCVYRQKGRALVFGTGELAQRNHVPVVETHYHPSTHLEAQSSIDLVHTLLLNDLAYLVLERAVPGVTPIGLPTAKPKWGTCDAELVGYGKSNDDRVIRKGVGGCVVLNAKLSTDAIVEVKPNMGGAVCHRDGDEGHPALRPRADGTAELIGVYVGSVTGSFTDCRRYLQLLNGYEESVGHADFYRDAIAASRVVAKR